MNPARNRQRGKAAERSTAKRLSGKRIGTMGAEDVEHSVFSFEVKERQAFVACNWMDQAIRNAPEGKIPLVIVHVHGQRHNDDLVIWRMKDFEDWNGRIK